MAGWQDVKRHCEEVSRPLWSEFETHRPLLLRIAKQMYPEAVRTLRTNGIPSTGDGTRDAVRYLTLVPVEALQHGATGFHANLTSPSRQWFRFRLKGLDTAGNDENTHQAMVFLDALRQSVETVFSSSGTYNETYRLYSHLLAFNFGCMLLLEDLRGGSVVRSMTLPVGSYALGLGADGHVNRVARRYGATADQLVDEFGAESLPQDVVRNAGKSRELVEVNCLIEPNRDLGPDGVTEACGLDPERMSYRAIYWLKGTSLASNAGVLRVAGYRFNPIIAPRLNCETGDVYGTGRGEKALPLARGLQTLRADQLQISGNRAEPAVIASADLLPAGLNMGRGGINYVKFGAQAQEMVQPVFRQPPDSGESREDFNALASEIQQVFYNDAFKTIDALKNNPGVKTATEIQALVRENMEGLGPVCTSLDRELLDPMVTVIALYCLSKGAVDAEVLPDMLSLLGGRTSIEYVSAIHVAQRAQSLTSIEGFLNLLGSAAGILPDIVDNADGDAIALDFARLTGLPEHCLRSDEKRDALRQNRAQAQAQAQQSAQAQAQAKALKDVGSLPTDPQHLAGGILSGVGGAGGAGGAVGGAPEGGDDGGVQAALADALAGGAPQ